MWAIEGGLNEESKMKSVFGDSFAAGGDGSLGCDCWRWRVLRTRNFEGDVWKLLSEMVRSETNGLKALIRDATGSSVIVEEWVVLGFDRIRLEYRDMSSKMSFRVGLSGLT